MQRLQWQGHGIRPYAARKSQEVWNQYEGIINTLYAQRWTHAQIRKILKDEHGLDLSKGQLRRRLLQAPPRNTAAISSSSPSSHSRRPRRKSGRKLVVPQQVPKTTRSSVPSPSLPSPSDHVPDPPVCHLDSSTMRLSTMDTPLSESVEDVIRRYTTLLDEGFELGLDPDQVLAGVGSGESEPDQQQTSQTDIAAPELPHTVLTHYQPIPQMTTDTLHTNSDTFHTTPDTLHTNSDTVHTTSDTLHTTLDTLHTTSNPDSSSDDIELEPFNDFSDNTGSFMPKEWSALKQLKGVDELRTDFWARVRKQLPRNQKATHDTTTSGKLRLHRRIRTRAIRVCCACSKIGASKICKGCRHTRCSGCGSSVPTESTVA